MGYQDREYMRVEGADHAQRGSNPLWWVLGLIALILAVSFFRRSSIQPDLPRSVQELVENSGPLRTCAIELVTNPEQARQLMPVLRTFFHEQGYDSTIHESADGSMTSASFTRQSADERLSRHVVYQHIGEAHKTLKPKHTLVFHVLHIGRLSDKSQHREESNELSGQLRLRLEAQFPGIVAHVDDTPQPVAYDDYE